MYGMVTSQRVPTHRRDTKRTIKRSLIHSLAAQKHHFLLFPSMEENKAAMDLPDDCWELVFKKLGHHDHLDATSLVSRRFLSISNCLRHSLTISDPIILRHSNFSKLSRRFRHVKRIIVSLPFQSCKRVDDLLLEIAHSGLDLEELTLLDLSGIPVKGLKQLGSTMKYLKTLTCTGGILEEGGLIAIANLLPSLQELKVSNFFYRAAMYRKAALSDKGMEMLASKLKHIIISGHAANGFHALRYCSNLNSLTIDELRSPATFTIDKSLSYSKTLCSLEFQHSEISNALLASIVQAHLPLKKLRLHDCENITPSGLSILLREYHSLTNFTFTGSKYLTDQDMDHLSKYLRHVTHIDLFSCSKLTNATFLILAKSCPLLVDIRMNNTRLGEEGDLRVDLKRNSQLQVLDLGSNPYLRSDTFKKIGHVCPNLRKIDLSYCQNLTEVCLSELLKSCPGLRHFIVNYCKLETVLGTYSEHSKLNIEVLEATDARINEMGMAMIAMRCPGLLKLKLRGCREVTSKGVKEVVEKCPNVMEIDLKYCYKVGVDVLCWMLLKRPSLRKVFCPHESLPTEEKMNLFMRPGCRLL